MKRESKIKLIIIIGAMLFCISIPILQLISINDNKFDPNFSNMLYIRLNKVDNLIVEKVVNQKVIKQYTLLYEKDKLVNIFSNIELEQHIDKKNNIDTINDYIKLSFEKSKNNYFYLYRINENYYVAYPNISIWQINKKTYDYFSNLID